MTSREPPALYAWDGYVVGRGGTSMVDLLVAIGIILVMALGFYFTRSAAGPPPLSAEGRAVDAESRAGPLGEPIPQAGDEAERPE